MGPKPRPLIDRFNFNGKNTNTTRPRERRCRKCSALQAAIYRNREAKNG